jgi:hypothetical protein
MRLIQEINQNFALAYEGSYQYMDLKPEGYNDRHAVNGSFYKLTFAPTFKVGASAISSAVLKSAFTPRGWTGAKNWIITPAMTRWAAAVLNRAANGRSVCRWKPGSDG